MGPHKTIDRSSCIYQWAHAIPSAAVAAYADGPTRNHQQQQLHIAMGPNKAIGSICWETNGPIRSHQQQQQRHMQMGPCGAIDSNSCICRWAHTKPSATAAAYFDGPKRSHQQQQPHMSMGPRETIGSSSSIRQWAHAKPSATAVAYADGPMRYHRQQQPHIPMGPLSRALTECSVSESLGGGTGRRLGCVEVRVAGSQGRQML